MYEGILFGLSIVNYTIEGYENEQYQAPPQSAQSKIWV
jgi:hypothetical protein